MKKGFLPIKTNWFDRLFIAVITFLGIQFIWMRFVEEFAAVTSYQVPLFWPTVVELATVPVGCAPVVYGVYGLSNINCVC